MIQRLSQFLWVLFGGLWALLAPRPVDGPAAGNNDGTGEPVWLATTRASAIQTAVFGLPFFLLRTAIPAALLNRRFWPEQVLFRLPGLLLQIAGLSYALWARLVAREGNGSTAPGQRGPYRFTHHPVYAGILVALLGSALVIGQVRGLLALAVLLAAYPWRKDLEQAALRGSAPRW
jgi:protein-S-isoprenylcysteine O-methyltransferase Ste14